MPGPSKKILEEGFYEFKKSAGKGLCWVKGCRNFSRDDRCMCHMHMQRRWRAKNEVQADYANLKSHAKSRGLDFDLSPDYWRGLTDAFNYYGKRDETPTIDRIDPTKGYVEGNLRVISLSENAAKGIRESYLPEHIQSMLDRKRKIEQDKNAKYLELTEDPDEEWFPLESEAKSEENQESITDDYIPF